MTEPRTETTNSIAPNPTWWTEGHSASWARVKEAFQRDWEQTKADFSSQDGQRLNQGLGDTLGQALGSRPLPITGEKTRPSDAQQAEQDTERARRRAKQVEVDITDAKAGIASEHVRLNEKIRSAQQDLLNHATEAHGKIAKAQDKAVDGIQAEHAKISAALSRREEANAEWLQIEQAARYGHAVRTRHPNLLEWNSALEATLQPEWERLGTGRSWEDSKRGVRRGWDYVAPATRPPA